MNFVDRIEETARLRDALSREKSSLVVVYGRRRLGKSTLIKLIMKELEPTSGTIIVNGHNKARALYHAVEGSINQMWTISALQMHEKGIIVADDAATFELKVGTYRYFKDIEADHLDPASLLK